MESKNYLCGGTKFAYSRGYIGLSVEVNNLPEIVIVNSETLQKKSSFHVSLLCVKDILAKHNNILEQDILDAFCDFVQENDVSFTRYTGEFRLAQDGERKTLVALCEVANLGKLFQVLNKKLGITLPLQPTHVTLYTLQPEVGIGLNSHADLETKSALVEPAEIIKQGVLL